MTQIASVDFDSAVGAAGVRSRCAIAAIASGASKWLIPMLVVALWQGASGFGLISDTLLPAPTSVIAAGWRLTQSGELGANIEISFLRAIAGLVVGGGIGLALGLANALSKISENLTESTLQMIRNVPHLALIPLVIVWFGIDEGANCFLSRSAFSSPSTSTRCTAYARSIRS
jgi:ABC-type nitrate/sulfonate/bicarbonate transport system permease component